MQQVEETTAEDIIGPMVENHPEVRPNAVMAHQKQAGPSTQTSEAPATESKPESQGEVIKDKSGEKFNPDKHYGDQYGRPQLTEGGYFRKIPLKKRLKRQAAKVLGRSEESEKASESPKVSENEFPKPEKPSEPASEAVPNVNGDVPPESEMKSFIPSDEDLREPESSPKGPKSQPADEYRAAAKAICSTIFTLGISVGGVQCKPLPQHVESMESAYENYFRQRGVTDIPPGVAVLLATGGYGLFCYQSSQLVQQQVGGIRGWIIRKIGKWKTERAARKAQPKGDSE